MYTRGYIIFENEPVLCYYFAIEVYRYTLHAVKKENINPPGIYKFIYGFCQRRNSNFIPLPVAPISSCGGVLFFPFFCFIFSKVIGPTRNHPSATHPCPLFSVVDEWWLWLKTAVYQRDVLAEWHKINITLFATTAFRKSRNKSKPFTIIKRTFWGQPQRDSVFHFPLFFPPINPVMSLRDQLFFKTSTTHSFLCYCNLLLCCKLSAASELSLLKLKLLVGSWFLKVDTTPVWSWIVIDVYNYTSWVNIF